MSIYRKGTEKLIKFPLVTQQADRGGIHAAESVPSRALFFPLKLTDVDILVGTLPAPLSIFFPLFLV